MLNTTFSSPLRGSCPPPFFDAAQFGTDGYTSGRFCAPVPQLKEGLVCCLPCPYTDFLYPAEFKTSYRAAEALNVVGLILMVFLMLSFIFLPADKTRRHYLSYCLIVGAILMSLGFVVPFGARPQQCYDEITPNDMFSDITCAFSGALLIAGGLSLNVWIFIRALSMHLQICWDVLPGKQFFYWAQGLGWAVVAAIFTITITVTGVSYRFGEICHVNSAESLKDFWGPLLVIAGAATLVQLTTFAYCIKVYVQNMWSDDTADTQSSGLPSYTTSVRTRSARVVYRRVRKVLWLQWRGITIVVFILVDVIFFSVIFIYLNSVETHATDDITKFLPYLMCLMDHPTEPTQCFEEGQKLLVNQTTVTAVLIMLSLVGIQCFLLLARTAMFTGWYDLIRSRTNRKREFVSLDAKAELNQFELNKVPFSPIRVPESAFTSPQLGYSHDIRATSQTPDFLSRDTREYKRPHLSFSTPQAPTRGDWDPKSSYGRGGLGLHPIDDDYDYDEKKSGTGSMI